MAYNKDIPQKTDKLSRSQLDLLNNFQQLNTSFDIDHYTYDNTTPSNGFHRKVSLVEQAADPTPTTGTDDLYTKITPPITGLGELYYVRGGSVTPIQMTSGSPFPYTNNYIPVGSVSPVGTDFTAGATFLPGGVLIQYGQVKTNQTTVKYPIPFSSSPYSLQLTLKCIQNSGSSRVGTTVSSQSSVTSFTYQLLTVDITKDFINWIAMGPA